MMVTEVATAACPADEGLSSLLVFLLALVDDVTEAAGISLRESISGCIEGTGTGCRP